MNVPPEFTQWWDEHGQFVRAGGGQYEISFAFAAWQESRRDALEEAAKLIEPRNTPDDWTEYARIRAEAANSIRSLAASDSDGGKS